MNFRMLNVAQGKMDQIQDLFYFVAIFSNLISDDNNYY